MWLYRFLFVAAVSLAPALVFAATLELAPANTTVNAGESVTLTVFVSSNQSINAVAGSLSYPSNLLSVTSVSKASSVLNFWVEEPSYSNGNGTVSWSGVVPNPGYTGSQGKIVSVRFKAKQAGTASVSFSSPQVLANDGNGTNILTGTTPATITIYAASSQPSPAPETPTVEEPTPESPAAPSSEFPISLIFIAILFFILGWLVGRSTKK